MGAYLPKPITKKESTDHEGSRLNCGASSMQGWRLYQEDAHNVIIDFDEKKSLFAVYDGHGGAEVAHYSAKHLPDFIKNTKEFKEGNYREALINAFIKFDESLIKEEALAVLKVLKKETEGEDSYANTDEDVGEDEDEENVSNLYEEATMPLNEVISRYRNPKLKELSGDNKPMSPMLKSKDKRSADDAAGCSSKAGGSGIKVKAGSSGASGSSSGASSSEAKSDSSKEASSSVDEEVSPSKKTIGEDVSSSSNGNEVSDSTVKNGDTKENGGDSVSTTKEEVVTSSEKSVKDTKDTIKNESLTNGDSEPDSSSTDKKVTNGNKRTSPRKTKELGTKSLLENSLDDDSSESDEDFNMEESSEDSDDEASLSRVPTDGTSDEDSEDLDEEEDDDEDDDTSDEEGLCAEYKEKVKNAILGHDHKDVPGMDSGCTAVVVLFVDNRVYIANAGDSRAVLSHMGKARDLSDDHKPEDEIERDRIVKAGGEVTSDGRVNGGLNLSRALGDHSYKQNSSLPLAEQMITALPDVSEIMLEPGKDEFIVLACDGIWNSLSSQDVVDFVGERIKENKKLSTICEELFDKCLAPDSMGDGTGCDNMTCVIVKISPTPSEAEIAVSKRTREEDNKAENENPAKKPKVDENEAAAAATTTPTPATTTTEETVDKVESSS